MGKTKQKRGRFSKEEIQYLTDNVGKLSIEEMAVALNRKIDTIAKQEAVFKYRPVLEAPQEVQQSKNSNINTFVRKKHGNSSVVQMTGAASEAGSIDKSFKHLHDTGKQRDGLTTMSAEKEAYENNREE